MIAAWKQLCRRFWYVWRRFSTICHVLGWHCSWEPNLLAQLYPTYVVCENDLQKAGTNYILHNDRIWHIVMWSPEPGAERCWRTKGPHDSGWLFPDGILWWSLIWFSAAEQTTWRDSWESRGLRCLRFLGRGYGSLRSWWNADGPKTLLKSNSWIPQIGCHPAMFYKGDIWYICSKAHQTIIVCYLC